MHWSLPLSTFPPLIDRCLWYLPSLSPPQFHFLLSLHFSTVSFLIFTLCLLFFNIIFLWKYWNRKLKHLTKKVCTSHPYSTIPLCSLHHIFIHPSIHQLILMILNISGLASNIYILCYWTLKFICHWLEGYISSLFSLWGKIYIQGNVEVLCDSLQMLILCKLNW